MKNLTEFENLNFEEMINLNGGESAWYWVSYGVGTVVRGFIAFGQGGRDAVESGIPLK